MKTVAIPILEGHSSVVVYPHCSQDKQVSSICIRFNIIIFSSIQDLSSLSLFFNDNELPNATGQYMFLEFKASYKYCLIPSYRTDQGRLMVYESKPAFINLFKFSFEIAKVDRYCVCLNSIYYFVQWGPTDDGNKQHQDVDNKQQHGVGNKQQQDVDNKQQQDVGNKQQQGDGYKQHHDVDNKQQHDIGNKKQLDVDNKLQQDVGNKKQQDLCNIQQQDVCEKVQQDVGYKQHQDVGNKPQRDVANKQHQDVCN